VILLESVNLLQASDKSRKLGGDMKRISFFRNIIFFGGMLFLISCGSNGSTAGNKTENVKPDLKGTWAGDCSLGEDGNMFKQTIEINETQLITKTNGYDKNDSNCATVLGLWEHIYDLSVGEATTTSDGQEANKLDLALVESFHTMKTQFVTDFWNSQPGGFCGKSDWVLDVPFEITGNACNFVKASAGETLYDIVKLDAVSTPNTIQFGNRTSDVNNRPQSLTSPIYKKL